MQNFHVAHLPMQKYLFFSVLFLSSFLLVFAVVGIGTSDEAFAACLSRLFGLFCFVLSASYMRFGSLFVSIRF